MIARIVVHGAGFVRSAVLATLLGLLVLSVPDVGAREYSITETVFVPKEFYVGDIVEMRMRIRTGGGVVPSEPAELPSDDWIRIHEARVVPIAGEYDVRIRFTSFYPGKRTLPPLRLGEITLDGIEIDTPSLLEARDRPMFVGIMDPLRLPGTSILLALVVGGLFVAPIALIYLVRWGRHIVYRAVGGVKGRRPYGRLRKELDLLEKSSTAMKSREFYIRLLDAFKGYLSDRTGKNFHATTSSEMESMFRNEFSSLDSLDRISPMFGKVDGIKFGGGGANHIHRQRDLDLIRTLAEEVEALTREEGTV